MRIHPAILTFALLTVSAAAQQKMVGPTAPANVTPKLDLSLGFSHMQANAPPGVGNDFGLNGGSFSAAYHFDRYLAAATEVTGGHASNISNLGQGLVLFTYTAGPRVTYYGHRVEPFGQALFGFARATDSYFPLGAGYTTGDSGFAYTAGGGVDVNLTHRLAIRALEVQFLHTPFRNGTSNVQRHLVAGAGIVFKFGGRVPVIPPPPPPAGPEVVTRPRGDIHFSCTLQVRKVVAGQPLKILGETMTEPDHLDVMYTWMPEAGMIVGSGREVVLNTTGLPPGNYKVRGHAAVMGDYAMGADCELPFEIDAPPVATVIPPPPPPPPVDEPRQKEFHTNVPDAYFDYNSAAMRMDARAATAHAADYLNSHPDMRVRVEGFADERGSVEYNLMLGQQRAEAARGALINAGVDPARVEIISFGKADPVCAEANETCYRQNRRAAFSLHP